MAHPTRNGDLGPKDVGHASHKEVWWMCSEGHEWQAPIVYRTRGAGCPFCNKRRVTAKHNLKAENPGLAKEWHPTKNGELRPQDVTPGSNKRVWWMCARGHEWDAMVSSRNAGSGCPYCSHRRVCEDNCLKTLRPDLAEEWHRTKNGKLTPRDVMPGSHRKVWWQCKKGHEWQAAVRDRTVGKGCPYCVGRSALSETYNLEVQNSGLASQWHPEKNDKVTPRGVTPGSGMKVWWICGKGHEYQATVANRTKGRGCPYCAGKAVSKDNCLAAVNPILSRQWHPTKNQGLTPKDVTSGTLKKVWWRCGNGHEWEATINSRHRGAGCPYCSGRLT